jgi:predicted ATP-grasp superfamily ATP-dependent carboligase
MLTALEADFARIRGIETTTLHVDPSFEEREFRQRARRCNYAVVIAPEFDEILLSRCRWAVEEGCRLLGPTLDAIALTADKLRLSAELTRNSVPTPVCTKNTPRLFEPAWVWKPQFGAGSTHTYLVRNANELRAAKKTAAAAGWRGKSIFQRYVTGKAVSIGFLIGPKALAPLLPCSQELSSDGRFRYLGGRVPIDRKLAARARKLGKRAIDAVPGLSGYVGVDLVLGQATNGSEDWVIEVNPRLTTSFLGVREVALSNLARAMLLAVRGDKLGPLRWSDRRVSFNPDGTNQVSDLGDFKCRIQNRGRSCRFSISGTHPR